MGGGSRYRVAGAYCPRSLCARMMHRAVSQAVDSPSLHGVGLRAYIVVVVVGRVFIGRIIIYTCVCHLRW